MSLKELGVRTLYLFPAPASPPEEKEIKRHTPLNQIFSDDSIWIVCTSFSHT